jgi:hypothetical protein
MPLPFSLRNTTKPRISPPAKPIADATAPSEPGRSGNDT